MKGARILSLVLLVWLTLVGCTTRIETVEVPGPTQVVTATPPSIEDTTQSSKLVICQDAEPENLYLYGGAWAAENILEAIYDGPIDRRSYEFEPVILEKLPTLEDGDAYFETIIVQAGDWVVNSAGDAVELEEGIEVLPSHTCWDANDPECVVAFDGSTPIEMEQMVVYWQLLEGVSWSDGEPVTAEDSVYSYDVACHQDTPALPSVKDLCEYTSAYSAWGEYTTVWTSLPGYVDDLYQLNFFSPLPSHLWRDELGYTATELLSRPESTRQPIGWGPFLVSDWVVGEYLLLDSNPLYFRAHEGLPMLDQIEFRFADGINGVITMLLAGDCDVGLLRDGQLGRLRGDLEQVMPLLVSAQEEGLLDLAVSSSEVWEHLEFGINPVPEYDRPAFFDDARVRQAFARCIDRDTMVEEATFGLGQIADVYISAEHPLFEGGLVTRWNYNPQIGESLLAEAGWIDEDEDGVVEANGVPGVSNGASFRVELLVVADDELRDSVARMIRSDLSDCGVQVDLVYVPLIDFLADGPQGPLMGRQFDLALFHWSNGPEPPCDLYLTEQIPDRADWGRFNISGFSDEEYDLACRAALGALPETREYETSHSEAQQIFSEQLPDIPLFWWVRFAIVRPGTVNLTIDSTEASLLWNIESLAFSETTGE